MKAIRMRIQKSSRPLVILLATVVAIITSMVTANAVQTITTPNAAFISYSLAPGATSTAITPVSNRSVLVMGCTNAGVLAGAGHVSLLHIPGNGMTWAGVESPSGQAVTAGSTGATGQHIVWIDFSHKVDIQVASLDTIFIHNAATGGAAAAGNLTLIW